MTASNMLRACLAALTIQGAVAQYPASQDIPPTLDLDTLGNNSLYLRWRPQYHVLSPNGHMNDPCGPMYDPERDLFHIFYQAHPMHVGFGNTSWGHAVSKDMVDWTDVNGWENKSFVAIELSPFYSYDWIGAFSGGAYPVGIDGKRNGNLTLMYTGAARWPDNWQVPYALGPPATEQQAIATSSDGGVTWQKWEGNPWLNGQPGNWNVTGLRDPVFAPNPKLDAALEQTEPHYYLTMGSGIRDVGPRIPLFTAKATDLTNWTFLGALWEPHINFTWGGNIRTGNHGANYELAGFFDEVEKEEFGGDGNSTHWVATFGAEGYADPWHPLAHWSLFALGSVHRRENGSAEFEFAASGVADWGNNYALNQFYDSKNDRRVIWGWSDEDLNGYALLPQGFQGSLTLPRELFILKKHQVLAPTGGVQKSAEIWDKDADGTYTVTTVAQRPLPDVVAGIQGPETKCIDEPTCINGVTPIKGINSSHYHLQVNISQLPEPSNSSYAGINLRESPNKEEFTSIRYYPANSSIVLDRTHSSLIANFSKETFVGHFERFQFAQPNGQSSTEDMIFDIYVDGSLLEIFINDRFAMTSRIYPSRADALGASLESEGGDTIVESVKAWQSMKNVWPERPLNASSPLVFDPYYETHVTFENPYVPEGTKLYDGN